MTLESGSTLLHYRLVEKIGEGGMGVVWRAEDTKLDRQVALKVLPAHVADDPERRRRFEREAKTIAALNHPNIVTLYSVEEDAGVHFLTMELVSGSALSEKIPEGGLPLARFFDLAVPIADALSQAHGSGITHRDLKPQNVMVGPEGRVKVLDFGLAKLREVEPSAEAETQMPTASVTQEGKIVGTVAYMSPEQAEGRPVDPRSDVFSLGILLYEMATGRRPFAGDTPMSILSSIIKDTPRSIVDLKQELPRHLDRIVQRCLVKDPARRYQSALELRNELEHYRQEIVSDARSLSETSAVSAPAPAAASRLPRWALPVVAVVVVLAALAYRGGWFTGDDGGASPEGRTVEQAAAAVPERRTILVLPFESLGAGGDEYFGAGMAEEITSRLGSLGDVGVISRKTALRYASTDKSTQEIGDELGVDYILAGTVRWATSADETRVRITPRLVRVSDDIQVWSDTYDRVIEDVFEVQSDIAGKVIGQLGVSLGRGKGADVAAPPTDNIEAYQAYLRGVEAYGAQSQEGWELSEQMFVRAVELDPEFAKAWGHLSRVRAFLHFTGNLKRPWCDEAGDALARTKALAPGDPLTRLEQGYFHYYCERDFERARGEFEVVARERPNDAEVLAAYSFILRRLDEMDLHLENLEAALELDPQNIEYLSDLAASYRGMRRFEDADRLYARAIAVAPDLYAPYYSRAENLLASRGDLDGARAILAQAPGNEDNPIVWAVYDCWAGDCEGALERLARAPARDEEERVQLLAYRGYIEMHLGRIEDGRALLEEAAGYYRARVKEFPLSGSLRGTLGVIEARLGRAEEAIRLGEKAVQLTASDRFAGPSARQNLALILMTVGETDRAIDILEELLAVSYQSALTPALLRVDPDWAPLRDDPRIQALIAP